MDQTKRQKQKEFTRQKIIDAAFRLYSDNGLSIATNTIAQEAGVSHGAIFVHFPTRELLQHSVLEQFANEVGNKLHGISTNNGTIAELLYGHIRVLEDYEAFYKNVVLDTSRLPEETKILLVTMQSTIAHHLSVLVEREQQKGTVKDIPLHMFFNTWLALLHYYLQNSEMFAPGESVLIRCKNELVGSFIKLISI